MAHLAVAQANECNRLPARPGSKSYRAAFLEPQWCNEILLVQTEQALERVEQTMGCALLCFVAQ